MLLIYALVADRVYDVAIIDAVDFVDVDAVLLLLTLMFLMMVLRS